MIADLLVIVYAACFFWICYLLYHLHVNRSPWGNWFWLVVFRRKTTCRLCQGNGCSECSGTGRAWEALPTDGHGKPVIFGEETEPLPEPGLVQPPDPTYPLGIPPFDEQEATLWHRKNRK